MAAWEIIQNYFVEKLPRRENVCFHTTEDDKIETSKSDYALQNLSEPIFSIPEEILLYIFSFLSASDLILCSEVSRLWYRVSSDSILWEHTLNLESKTWTTISSGTYWPDRHETEFNCNRTPSLHPKKAYLRCIRGTKPLCPGFMPQMSQIWRSLFFTKKSKLLMTGPGLDSRRTVTVVHNMVHDRCVEFEPINMIPGVNGFGAGLTFKLKIGEEFHLFDLVTLYSHRALGRNWISDQNQRIRNSNLFNRLAENEPLNRLEATQQVVTLCEKVDGIVFVIDAEDSIEEYHHVRHELRALLAAFPVQNKVPKSVPVLIPSLTESRENNDCKQRVSALHIARQLQLFGLPNQWLIQDSSVKDMSAIGRGILWIVHNCLSS